MLQGSSFPRSRVGTLYVPLRGAPSGIIESRLTIDDLVLRNRPFFSLYKD
jgi:hypothetical protein